MTLVELAGWAMAIMPLAPLAAFVAVAAADLLRPDPLSEGVVARLVTMAAAVSFVAALTVAAASLTVPQVVFDRGPWFRIDAYEFAALMTVDHLGAFMLVLSSGLILVGVRFSVTYMHRDPGFRRFFSLMALFEAGLLLLIAAGTIDLLFAGWEIVGLTSTFLIAFFHGREGPLVGGLRAFVTYRSCDVGLLVGAVLLHVHAHASDFSHALATPIAPHVATTIALLFLLAAMGKSGAFPVGGWLPRAMEGPTPSSALFYGGLSVAAGAYLLLRIEPLFAASLPARIVLALVGVATVVHATLVGRVQSDAKSQLAWASVTQTGVVFVWIALGLRWVAMVHLLGHISLRTFQLFRAPTLLHDRHQLHGALDGEHLTTGAWLQRRVPTSWQQRLWVAARSGFGVEAAIDAKLVHPLLVALRRLDRLEQRVLGRLVRRESTEPSRRDQEPA